MVTKCGSFVLRSVVFLITSVVRTKLHQIFDDGNRKAVGVNHKSSVAFNFFWKLQQAQYLPIRSVRDRIRGIAFLCFFILLMEEGSSPGTYCFNNLGR